MPSPGGQFLSDEYGDIEDYFITDYWLIDQYIGDTLWVWGDGAQGQLGINASTDRSTPITTILGGTNWKSIQAGLNYTTAIKTDGTLWNWGTNATYGQLGINATTNRSTPVTTIVGGTNWKSFSCGEFFVAAIKTDGTLWTWGRNSYGALGVNDVLARSVPVTTIFAGNNWKSVACGRHHIAAIKTDGTLWTWGNNTAGSLGINSTVHKSTPITTIIGGNDWKSVSCGVGHVLSVKTDGTLWVWGRNDEGQLGINAVSRRSSPVTTIIGGTYWRSVSGGGYFTTAIKTDGTLWNWGQNTSGQLGDNSTVSRSTPITTLSGGTNWKYSIGGQAHIAAIKTDGSLWTWGSNTDAQLGINATTNRSAPVTTILGGNNWKSVGCGVTHTQALTAGFNVDFS
jgi:alpha-tubulin suppressor-like RCC1 family protein